MVISHEPIKLIVKNKGIRKDVAAKFRPKENNINYLLTIVLIAKYSFRTKPSNKPKNILLSQSSQRTT